MLTSKIEGSSYTYFELISKRGSLRLISKLGMAVNRSGGKFGINYFISEKIVTSIRYWLVSENSTVWLDVPAEKYTR